VSRARASAKVILRAHFTTIQKSAATLFAIVCGPVAYLCVPAVLVVFARPCICCIAASFSWMAASFSCNAAYMCWIAASFSCNSDNEVRFALEPCQYFWCVNQSLSATREHSYAVFDKQLAVETGIDASAIMCRVTRTRRSDALALSAGQWARRAYPSLGECLTVGASDVIRLRCPPN